LAILVLLNGHVGKLVRPAVAVAAAMFLRRVLSSSLLAQLSICLFSNPNSIYNINKYKMKKQRKLKLDELKVQSFVTELSPEVSQTAKGGVADDGSDWCTTWTVLSEVVKSIFGNSGASKWPCRKACAPSGGGGTGGDPSVGDY
jgi:hypothetical protein